MMSAFSADDEIGADGKPRRQEIWERYDAFNYRIHNFSRHRFSNFVIRVLDGGHEAWMSGYWHVSRTGWAGEVTSRSAITSGAL